MNNIEIYVHGTPRGHQIYGSDKHHDYINRFYNHDSKIKDKVILQIDIVNGISFYTYLRQNNIIDFEGRPQSFFALTVSFRQEYCTNVHDLFRLFDAVYQQLCLGTILKNTETADKFLVSDLKEAKSGAIPIVEKIENAFSQKLNELIVPHLMKLSVIDTYNKQKKVYSLSEVDSPIFFEEFKKYSIIVSPTITPAVLVNSRLNEELKNVISQRNKLTSNITDLQNNITELTKENRNLSEQIQKSRSSLEKQYREQIEHLEKKITEVKKEKENYRSKFNEITDAINPIVTPLQNLNRLLTGRISQDNFNTKERLKINDQEFNKKEEKSTKKTKRPILFEWLNYILLILVLVCSIVCLVFVVKKNNNTNAQIIQTDTYYRINNNENSYITDKKPHYGKEIEEESTGQKENTPFSNYDFQLLDIDIVGGSNNLHPHKDYFIKCCQ